MSKIDNLKAVAGDYDIPVSDLVRMVVGYPDTFKATSKTDDEVLAMLDNRIYEAEKAGLTPDYINGIKDLRKLLA